jgi:hypothetical protein
MDWKGVEYEFVNVEVKMTCNVNGNPVPKTATYRLLWRTGTKSSLLQDSTGEYGLDVDLTSTWTESAPSGSVPTSEVDWEVSEYQDVILLGSPSGSDPTDLNFGGQDITAGSLAGSSSAVSAKLVVEPLGSGSMFHSLANTDTAISGDGYVVVGGCTSAHARDPARENRKHQGVYGALEYDYTFRAKPGATSQNQVPIMLNLLGGQDATGAPANGGGQVTHFNGVWHKEAMMYVDPAMGYNLSGASQDDVLGTHTSQMELFLPNLAAPKLSTKALYGLMRASPVYQIPDRPEFRK